MNANFSSPLRYIGGKSKLIKWHLSRFPSHNLYVSVCGGGATDIFAKTPGNEILNDYCGVVANFWSVVRDKLPPLMVRLWASPLARKLLDEPYNPPPDGIEESVYAAWYFFVHNRQTFSGTGTGKEKANSWSISGRTRRGINESVSAWLSSIELLPEVSARLRNVALEHDDFENILKRYDAPDTFFYIDPPYLLPNKRTNDYYGLKFTYEDHQRLAKAVNRIQGKALVCGYRSTEYDDWYQHPKWTRETENYKKHAAATTEKGTETEAIYMNYPLITNEDEFDLTAMEELNVP